MFSRLFHPKPFPFSSRLVQWFEQCYNPDQ